MFTNILAQAHDEAFPRQAQLNPAILVDAPQRGGEVRDLRYDGVARCRLALMAVLSGEAWLASAAHEATQQIKRLMSDSKYERAVTYGQDVHASLAPFVNVARYLAEFDVHWGLAHVYTGRMGQGIALFKSVIKTDEAGHRPEDVARQWALQGPEGTQCNYALGRAYNNLGYAYWKQGHLAVARREFRIALEYFRASGLREEIANTCDNLGRMYVQLHRRTEAQEYIDKGFEIRQELGDAYRLALSHNSRAILHLEFGEPLQAFYDSIEALWICVSLGKQRGIGAADILLGRALREMALLASSPDKAEVWLSQAEAYLKHAVTLFSSNVAEPLRLTDAYRELGRVYRDQAARARKTTARTAAVRPVPQHAGTR
jgi:tetratricopeptide (TPR) repeat protein